MTTKRDYAASITTKGLDGTGLTEDIARKLYARRGRKCMAIVELVVDETSDKRDGTHKVALAIAGLELVLDNADIDNHLREVQQTIYYNRSLDEAQPSLDGGDGINPKVSDVIKNGLQHRPHPFLPVDASDDNGICDVCGLIDTAGVHSTQGFLPDGDDEGEGEGEGEEGEADEEQDSEPDGSQPDPAAEHTEPWEYVAPEPHQAGDEPTVTEVLAAKERHLNTVPDPFASPA